MAREDNAIVGIFMPAYNQGKYIEEALASLRAQTFQDFVVHIVDDGSDDGETDKIIKSIKYDKARIFLNEDNKGVAFRARQHYKMFKTKYVLVLCGDDALMPTFLEKTVEFLDEHPEYGAVSTGLVGYLDSFEKKPFEEVHYDEKKMGLPDMLAECHCLGSSLMRSEALRGIDLSGGFVRYQDWDRWISMLEAGWKLGAIDECLFKYRVHKESLSHTSTPDSETEVFEKIINKHQKLYQENAIFVEKKLFYNMFAAIRGSDGLVRSVELLKKANEALLKDNEELKNELKVSNSSFGNRVIRKLKKMIRF